MMSFIELPDEEKATKFISSRLPNVGEANNSKINNNKINDNVLVRTL